MEMSKNISLVKASDMKRRDFMRMVIIFQIVYLLVFNGLFASISILSKAKYLLDVATLTLCVGLFFDRRELYKIKGKAYYIPLLVYSIVCVVTAIVYKTEPLLFLWAIRNTFRFFVFFFACVLYIRKEDIKSFFDFLLKLQIINLPLMIIQYFYFKPIPKAERGILADNIGGIFGSELGGNGRLNIYLCIILIIALINYFETEKLNYVSIFSIVNVMICASLAELKVFIPEAIVVFIVCSIFYFKNIKKSPLKFFRIFYIYLLFLLMCYFLMIQIYPYTEKDFESYGGYEKKTSTVYRLGRIGAFQKINEKFFYDSVLKKLFGLGFGNCEYSSFSFLVSDFYNKYGEYNYRWFSHQMLYLETGAVGFISFASFFITMAIQALVIFHKQSNYRKIAVFSMAISVVLFSNLWYNCMIRSDFGYVCYFCLSFVSITINDENIKLRKE